MGGADLAQLLASHGENRGSSGAPVYDSEAVGLSGLSADKAIEAITPAPIQKLPDGSPILYAAFPEVDQKLFTSALLAACDNLYGRVDGVVDNLQACQANSIRPPSCSRTPGNRFNARLRKLRPASAQRRSTP